MRAPYRRWTHPLRLLAFAAVALAWADPVRAATSPGFERALAASDLPRLVTEAEAIAAARGRGAGGAAARAAAYDTLGLQCFLAGTPAAWDAADTLLQRAWRTRVRALGPDDLEVARSASTLATLRDYQGRWDEAIALERRSLAIRTAVLAPNDARVTSSLRQLGVFHYQLGAYAAAESAFAEVLERARGRPDTPASTLVDAWNNLGETRRARSRYDEALDAFRSGLGLARTDLPPADPLQAVLLNNLAGLYKDLARYAEAMPLLERSLALRLAAGSADPEMLATAHLNLAEVYRLQGRAREAQPLYARALAEARAWLGPSNPGLIPYLQQSAEVERALAHDAAADSLSTEAQALLEATLGPAHPLVAQGLHDQAVVWARRGRAAEASALLTRAVAIRASALGLHHPETAASRAALAAAWLADSLASHPGAWALLDSAIVDLDAARAQPEAALGAHAARAWAHARAGRRREADADLAAAIALVDSVRAGRGLGDETRAAFVAGHVDLFDRMAESQLDRGDVAGAFETLERVRARSLLDRLTVAGVDLRTGIPSAERAPLEAAERNARARLAGAQERLRDVSARSDLAVVERFERVAALEAARDSAARDVERAGDALRAGSPLWRDVLSAGGAPVALAAASREVTPKDGVLLLYHVGDTRSQVFVIPPAPAAARAIELVVDAEAARTLNIAAGPLGRRALELAVAGDPGDTPLQARAGLAELLAGDRSRVRIERPRAAGRPDPDAIALHALWRTLVPEGVWKGLRRAREVVVVPDGALHLLPFEALVTQPPRDAQVRYWLDDGPPLRYASSVTSLARLEARARTAARGAGLVSVSDPAFPPGAGTRGGTWAPLPGTADETRALARAFAPETPRVLQGAQATEPAVRDALPGRQLVHLATHGFVGGTAANLAGLVLAASPADSSTSGADGLLQLYEIYELSLAADLAVLSACETQRGPRFAGEGVFALARAFEAAGAHRVVASLWAVQDSSTAALMEKFFAPLAEAQRRGRTPDTARALRDARRAVRDDPRWGAPFHWAPFVLSGVR